MKDKLKSNLFYKVLAVYFLNILVPFFGMANNDKPTDPPFDFCDSICGPISNYEGLKGIRSLSDFLKTQNSAHSTIPNQVFIDRLKLVRINFLENAPGKIDYHVLPSKVIVRWSNRSVDIHLGRLSLEQFNYLQKYFNLRNPFLIYDSNFDYDLSDFLDPALQALIPLTFLTNCFGFIGSYFSSNENRANVFIGHDSLVELLENKNFFKRIYPGERVQPGDIVLDVFKDEEHDHTQQRNFTIFHAEIYVDDNLTLSSNPNGFHLGGVRNDSNEDLLTLDPSAGSNFFDNGIFRGSRFEQRETAVPTFKDGSQLRIYRQISAKKPLLLPKFGDYIRLTVPFSMNEHGQVEHHFENSYQTLIFDNYYREKIVDQ